MSTSNQDDYDNTEYDNSYNDGDQHNGGGGGSDDWDTRKAFLSRIPTTFDSNAVQRILQKKFGEGCVEDVSIVYSRDEGQDGGEGGEGASGGGSDPRAAGGAFDKNTLQEEEDGSKKKGEHRGFGFVTFTSTSIRDEAIKVATVRGGAKEGSKRKHTVYIRPLDRSSAGGDGDGGGDVGDDSQQNNKMAGHSNSSSSKNACHLWSLHRCPYGDACKFDHIGEGGCIERNTQSEAASKAQRDKKKKCFSFKKRGKCKMGEDCPFSHHFVGKNNKKKNSNDDKATKKENNDDGDNMDGKTKTPIGDRDCINWKTKGKCRKLNSKAGCPYRHDKAVKEAALAKKKRKRGGDGDADGNGKTNKEGKEGKTKQPLSVRVFGMNYDTKEEDIRAFFQDCGPIVDITFPTFEDSGRSKGYCGVLFQSPKAVEKAVQLNEAELHGRWLSVQAGKMFLKQWQEREMERKSRSGGGGGGAGDRGKDGAYREEELKEARDSQVGEFGQKVKKRKKHGYKE